MAKGRMFKRCMWYNEFGEPRTNPNKIRKGLPDITGCQFDRKCDFVHPGDPGWLDAPFTAPKPHFYEDGIVPPTPSPPRLSKRLRTPDFDRNHVKQEYMSPTISSSKYDHETASARSRDWRGSRSPREWDRGKRRYDYGESSTGRSGDAERERYPRDREHESGREGDYRRDRGRDYERTDHDHRLNTSTDRTREHWKKPPEPSARRGNLDSPGEPTRTASSSFADRERDQSAPASGDARRASPKAASRFNADRAYTQTPPLPQPAVASSSRLSASSSAGSPRLPPDSALSAVSFTTQASSMLPPPTPTPMSATPAPIPPSFLTSPQIDIPEKQILSLEERKEIWDKRIELFMEAISARQVYKRLSDDIKVLESLVKSSRYANYTPALRDPIDATIANTEKQRDEARKRAEEVHNRIYALDFWPLRKRPTGDQADDSVGPGATLWEDEQEEIKSMVHDLSGAVSRLDRQLREVFQYVVSRTRANLQATPSISSEQEMQLDGARSAKRRKVGDEGAYASDSGSTIVGHLSPTPAFVSSAGDILDAPSAARIVRRVEALEATYADLENFCTQTEHTRTDEVGGIVEMHLERFRSQLGRNARVNQMELLKTLEAGLEQTGNDVGELATTVAELVESVGNFRNKEDAYASEREQVARERAEIRTTIEAKLADTEPLKAQIRANLEETAALRDALARMQQPTPAPHVPSIDELVEALLPRVLDSVHEDLAARLEGARSDLVAVVREERPAIELIREKVERLQGLPDVLALLNNLPREPNGPATVATATDENKSKKNQQANGRGHAT
ncbi:hypothetical protein M0805_006840 [Coniferiporia weirii]|nr:hypothetical protein M0805_006840 [Coniferiporia weirii]